MGLDELADDVTEHYEATDEELAVALDQQTSNELALLETALEPEETDELVRRAIHDFFESVVATGTIDFHLRNAYDVTYDEYISGVTFDEMTGGAYPQSSTNEDRRYQF